MDYCSQLWQAEVTFIHALFKLKRGNFGPRHCLTKCATENKLLHLLHVLQIADLGININFLRRRYLIDWYELLHPHIMRSIVCSSIFIGPTFIWDSIKKLEKVSYNVRHSCGSSDWSSQSNSPSHFHATGMQRPVSSHCHWSSRQLSTAVREGVRNNNYSKQVTKRYKHYTNCLQGEYTFSILLFSIQLNSIRLWIPFSDKTIQQYWFLQYKAK